MHPHVHYIPEGTVIRWTEAIKTSIRLQHEDEATEISEFTYSEKQHLLDKYKQKMSIALISKRVLQYKAILEKNMGFTEPENIVKTLQFVDKPLFSISNKRYFL